MNEPAVYNVIVSLASNQEQEKHLREARQRLAQVLTDLIFTEAIWTEPIGASQRTEPRETSRQTGTAGDFPPLYLNQLVYAKTSLEAEQLNSRLKEIEISMGRTEELRNKGIVNIDLDLMEHNGTRYHVKDWEREYVTKLLRST